MKVKFLLLLAVLTIIFTSCQNTDELKEISKPGTNGNYRIEIVGKQADQQDSRSSGTIQFEGGTASGAGLYDSKDKANVSATPDDGYEIDYFYGGPESEPKKYDNAKSGASIFDVSIDGQDHLFHVGFKKKERTLTINAGSGGSVTPSGKDTYQVNKPITITATAKPGFTFAGWEINEGDVTIADKNNATTTATLNNLNSIITAKFSNPYNLWVNMDMEYFSSYYDLTRKQYFKGEYIEVPYCGIEQELSDKTGARLLYDLENYGYFNSRILVDDNLLKTIDIDWGYDIYITNMIETAKCTLTVHSETDDSKDYIIYYVTSSLPVANETDDIVWEDISVNINITDRTDTFTLTIPKGQNKSNELKLTKLVNNNITKAVCNKRLMYTTFKGEEIPASLNVVY